MQLFVDINAANDGNGSQERPFKHIQQAADIAMPGDLVNVMPGIYHETVNPKHSGTADQPIIYSSVEQNRAVITGAQTVDYWRQLDGDVWTATIPNERFGAYNPYTVLADHSFDHAGEVFFNNQAMYEVKSRQEVAQPKANQLSRNPAFSTYTWYTEQDKGDNATKIYANFHGKDPNNENIEITTRETCFFPTTEGINHIVLSGFVITKAACRWGSAAYNRGMVGTNCGVGWKIINCDLSHAKCVGLSLGRYATKPAMNDDAPDQVRNTSIHDCGQAGILGGNENPSPVIVHNNIFNINVRQNLIGDEVSAIDLNPAINARITRNCIHDCTRGIWLSGQVAQTHLSRNICYNNTLPNDFKVTKTNKDALMTSLGEDIKIENSDGVTVVEDNLLLSDCAIKLNSKGILLIHNLINGSIEWLSNTQVATNDHYYYRLYQSKTRANGNDSSAFFNNIFVRKNLRSEMKKLIALVQQSEAGQTSEDRYSRAGNHFFAAQTVSTYLRLLGDTFLFLPCYEYNTLTAQKKSTTVRYFPIDPSIKNTLTRHHSAISAENLIALAFLRLYSQGWQVASVHFKGQAITFVANDGEESQYFQFAYSLTDQDHYQQVIAPLLALPTEVKKTLLVAKKPQWLLREDSRVEHRGFLEWLSSVE